MTFPTLESEDENPFANLVQNQKIVILPSVTLEAGDILRNVQVAYKTWGRLNETKDNVMVICHALTGSADVADWWGPLLGPGKAFDPSKFFVICLNSLGSPYGSASPCTKDSETGSYYGPEFPLVTVKDDVKIHKMVLDDLGISSIAVVIGGSMGGMLVLEYAYLGSEYVRSIVPIATCATHSAWGISWGETQRQSIYSDPKYNDGYYTFDDPPIVGLGAARMAAMLTYRSRNSFESKFGRNLPDPTKHKGAKVGAPGLGSSDILRAPINSSEERWLIHNHGHQQGRKLKLNRSDSSGSTSSDSSTLTNSEGRKPQTFFTAQTYLRYQAEKFVKRFDANCYISITRKLDSHDVSRGRTDTIEEALAMIKQPTLVIGISSDGLFTFSEQERLAQSIPNSTLHEIKSPEGHDAFLLEFSEINKLIIGFLRTHHKNILERDGISWEEAEGEINQVSKSSLFGEAEAEDLDVTNW